MANGYYNTSGQWVPTSSYEEAVDAWRAERGYSTGGTYTTPSGTVDTSAAAQQRQQRTQPSTQSPQTQTSSPAQTPTTSTTAPATSSLIGSNTWTTPWENYQTAQQLGLTPTTAPTTGSSTLNNIQQVSSQTGIPPAVLLSMWQQTGWSPSQDEIAAISDAVSQGYQVTQIDPRTGSLTLSIPDQPSSAAATTTAGPAAPYTGTVTTGTAGGGTATGDGYKMFKWTEGGYEAAGGNVPSWWTAFVPEEVTPETAYGAMLNAMIPYLAPEDQVRVAHSLYQMFDTELSRYKPGYIPEVSTMTEDQMRYLQKEGLGSTAYWGPTGPKTLATGEVIYPRQTEWQPLSDQMRRYFMSSQRARDAIETLSNMREAMVQGNRWKLGAGYKWLQNLLGSVAGRGAAGPTAQTRQQYLNMLSAVDPFLSQAQAGELQPFGPLGQMLTQPYYTAGPIMPQTQGRFGRRNVAFF